MRALIAMPRSFFTDCFDPADIERLPEELTLLPEEPFELLPEKMTCEWIAERIGSAELLITGWDTPTLSEDILSGAADLRAIVHSAGSVKQLLPASAFAGNIAVTNVRYALAMGVAETTLGMIIASAKMFVPFDRGVEKGRWLDPAWQPWIREFYQTTVGIIAASEVGKHLLGLLKMFEVDRLLYDPYADESVAAGLGARKVELDELCSASDIIAVCAPATDQTHHMIGRDQLALMKDRARLINTARGSIIDEAALAEELSRGRLYAFLDVTDPEPPAQDSPLRASPYCTITPHLAGYHTSGRRRMGRLAVDEILGFLATGRFKWQVSAEGLARQA